MNKQQKAFLPLLWLVLTSGCASTGFKISPEDMPDKVPPNVVIAVEGDDPVAGQSLARTVSEELARAGVNPEAAKPSGPSAVIRLDAHSTTYEYFFHRSESNGLGDVAPNANKFLTNVTFMNGEGSNPYLSISLSLNGAVRGVALVRHSFRYEGLESVDELKVKAARLIKALYLNALSGDPEPLEGEWMDIGDSGSKVVFQKNRDAARSFNYFTNETAVTIYGSSDNTYVMKEAEIGSLTADPYGWDVPLPSADNVTSFNGMCRYASIGSYPKGTSESWHSVQFRIYGCLMVASLMNDQGVQGRAFLVKTNKQRCHY